MCHVTLTKTPFPLYNAPQCFAKPVTMPLGRDAPSIFENCKWYAGAFSLASSVLNVFLRFLVFSECALRLINT